MQQLEFDFSPPKAKSRDFAWMTARFEQDLRITMWRKFVEESRMYGIRRTIGERHDFNHWDDPEYLPEYVMDPYAPMPVRNVTPRILQATFEVTADNKEYGNAILVQGHIQDMTVRYAKKRMFREVLDYDYSARGWIAWLGRRRVVLGV